MYTKLSLNNFRAFKEFDMDLKPITLISGKNNTGKTSILESVFAFHDYATPDVFANFLAFRGVKAFEPSAKSVWDPLFYNMNSDEPIEIKLNDKNYLRLSKNKKFALSKNQLGIFNGSFDISSGNYALSCEFKRESTSFIGEYFIGNEKTNFHPVLLGRDDNEVESNDEYIQYIGPNISPYDISVTEWFGKVELSRSKDKLIEILKMIDADIIDITTIATSRYADLYFTNKNKDMLPIHTIGDGMRKLLHIALVMLANPKCILLLDEVENGLHYSLYTSFWETISTLAIQLKCQIIATTHSYECISGALDGVKNAELENDFLYVRLDKNGNNITPKTFSYDSLERALDTDWEVR